MTDTLRNDGIEDDRIHDVVVEKEVVLDDGIQHGIDDDPRGDAGKGAALGGIGGAVVGGLAGAVTGPVGIAVGAAIGAVAGSAASGAAVAAVDTVDNDNNVTGIGDRITPDINDQLEKDKLRNANVDKEIIVTDDDAIIARNRTDEHIL